MMIYLAKSVSKMIVMIVMMMMMMMIKIIMKYDKRL
jgi:hypothetical protein